ncbi:MAG: SGNH/GDSL hydrolase family protein [Patescibacteria group bacterium]
MTQIFIFGASIVYGVGAEEAGWADLIKRNIHNRMYSKNGTGEKFEVYNFGNPDAKIEFILKTFEEQIENYGKDGKKIVVLSIGMNNAKAVGNPDNYVTKIDEYKNQLKKLFQQMKLKVDHVLCVGLTSVDEQKTTPKSNGSYFRNQRIEQFNSTFREVCIEMGITFVDILSEQQVCGQACLYKDGVHPNQKGHQLIFEKIFPQIKSLL